MKILEPQQAFDPTLQGLAARVLGRCYVAWCMAARFPLRLAGSRAPMGLSGRRTGRFASSLSTLRFVEGIHADL